LSSLATTSTSPSPFRRCNHKHFNKISSFSSILPTTLSRLAVRLRQDERQFLSLFGGQMYTLEDDQETSASLHKRDFANMSAIPEDQDSGGVNERTPDSSSTAHHSIPEHITNSLKKLASPNQHVANKRERRVALAALIIGCI